MKLFVNGEPHAFTDTPTLAVLLNQIDVVGHWAVAVNGNFVPRHQYERQQLNDSDRIDIVQPMQGG